MISVGVHALRGIREPQELFTLAGDGRSGERPAAARPKSGLRDASRQPEAGAAHRLSPETARPARSALKNPAKGRASPRLARRSRMTGAAGVDRGVGAEVRAPDQRCSAARQPPGHSMRRHALLIIACPRSGATALAGALAHAGATPGRNFVAAPSGEPATTWQCAPLVALNDRLLAAMGLRWDSLVAPPERWRERSSVKALIAEANALIASEYGNAKHVLLHDPRLSLTAPFWRERLERLDFDASAAIVVRRPVEVAASLSKREPFALEKTLALWLHYLCEGERGSRGMPRTLVTYDRLLDAPAGVLSHVVSECRFGLKIDRAQREAALTSIRPDLKHFGEERQQTAALSSGIDAVVDDGYRRLATLSPGTDARRTIEALAQEAYAPLTQAIPPWLAQELANDRVSAERQAELLAEARARVAALEQSLEQTRLAHASRDKDEVTMRDRIDTLSRTGNTEGRDARVDEALAQLRSDVGRIACTISDQPEREHALRLELTQAQRDLEDERSTISRLSQSLEQERKDAEAQIGPSCDRAIASAGAGRGSRAVARNRAGVERAPRRADARPRGSTQRNARDAVGARRLAQGT